MQTWPQQGSPAALGLEEWKVAYAAAYDAAAAKNGKWAARFGTAPSVLLTEMCTLNPKFYAFPGECGSTRFVCVVPWSASESVSVLSVSTSSLRMYAWMCA